MEHDHILIIDDVKPTGTKPAREPRESRSKPDDIIYIVESPASSATSFAKTQSQAKSSRADRRRENVKVDKEVSPAASEKPVTAASHLHAVAAKDASQDIDFGDTLPLCATVDEVRGWFLAQQVDFNEKVDRGFARRRLLDETRVRAETILHGVGAIPAYTLNNDRLALEAFEKLRTHIGGYVGADSANELALITFITGDGGTSMDRPVIEVRKSRKLVNDTIRTMKVPHWFGLIDLAFFWTIRHPDGGLHLQRHEHIIGWGRDFIVKAEAAVIKQSAKFTPNVTNIPGIKIKRAWDCSEANIARLAAYLLKAPAKGKNWFEYPDGSYLMNHTQAKDRYIQFLRLGQIRSMLCLEDVVLGGGDGIKIKGSMVDEMRGLAAADARGRAIMHQDQVATDWEDFNQELGQAHWSLPAILRR